MKLDNKLRARIFSAAALLAALGVQAASIEPPKIQLVDKNGVDMGNGQVTHSQFTVGIGGAMGISHSVSVHANQFEGFNGKFKGAGNNASLSSNPNYVPLNVYRIYDFDGTADFAYMIGSTIQQGGSGTCPGSISFKPLGDDRGILECIGNELVWTKSDGTESHYYRSGTAANSYASLSYVLYPSGFKISIYADGMGAITNTGFEIKAIYEADQRDFRDCSAQGAGSACKNDITTLQNTDPFYTSYASGWSNANPRYIKAINNAIEYCPPLLRDCSLNKKWPTATFNWAPGMPRTLSIGDTYVGVVDMTGKTTTYKFHAYDLAYETLQGGVVASGQTLNREFSPRLVGISSDGNDRWFTYDFTNVYVTQGGDATTWDIRLQESGKVISATLLGTATTGYQIDQPYYSDAVNDAYGIGGISHVQVKGSAIQGNPGAIYFALTDDGNMYRENTVTRNFPVHFDPANGASQDFEYTRGNLSKVIYRKNLSDSTYVQAGFPADCISTSRKLCNQAVWIRDARGNVTDYTYHPGSGQVASITYPANKHGIRAQTRFEYTQVQAHYFAGGASKIPGDLIWMKTAEKYCVNSSYANNACSGGDEVVTRYEYNNDNLLLTGTTVTSPPPNSNSAAPYNTTLRTCFKYDIYGNQIGKTEPNASLTSCP